MHEFTDEGLATHDRDIQAQALREAADDLDLPGSTATGYYASEAVSGYNDAERLTPGPDVADDDEKES